MSYEAIRFCSYCNLKSEELEKLDPPKVLKTCTICKIVQYCDQKCQRQDYVARHKRLCVDLFKPTKDRAADAYAMLKAKGFDPCTKGQEISEKILSSIHASKNPTKSFPNFCPRVSKVVKSKE